MITPPLPTPHAGSCRLQALRRHRQRWSNPTVFSATIFRLRPRLEVMEDRTLLSTFLVTNSGDSGPGSLRQAILDSDAATGTTNTIDFAIPAPGVQAITPLSPLPTITDTVLVDGESQPGYSVTPLIELSGTQAGTGDGFLITAPKVTVRGLDIGGFASGAGIHITGTGATSDWIYGNFLGTDPTGTQAEPNDYGVEIDGGAVDNLIGTNGDGIADVAERNVNSGNLIAGIWINGQGTDGNEVAGNFIGTSVTGDVALDNGTSRVGYPYLTIGGGIVIEGGAAGNRIGTDGNSVDEAGQRNVIAGSDNDGIDIIGAGTDGNIVAGNYIGTDVTGTVSLNVNGDGVLLAEGASSNRIGANPNGGGALGEEGNVISGARIDGIQIYDDSDNNVVAGDKIGTDATGAVALFSRNDGVEIDSSSGNTIGGTGAGTADVISGNAISGVELEGASDNLVEGNFIGTDATGTISLGNSEGGVFIGDFNGDPSTNNTIGGATAIAGNLITDNGGPGVVVGDSASDLPINDQITANRIFGNTGQAIDLGDDGVTYDSSAPRQGPNNLQNFPIIFSPADGELQGWMGGSTPDTTFRIDLFASAGYGPGGSGEAEDYLGSLDVTTDGQGQATFDDPFTPPAGLPIVTATATDPRGNTSEVSALRRATLQAPSLSVHAVANQSLVFATNSSDGIAIQDTDAGPLNPVWCLTLSVFDGTLTLSNTAGLTGSGDGTSSLSYSGPVEALDAALEAMIFNPPGGPHVLTTLDLGAKSYGAPAFQTRFVITDGVFMVDTTADSGPGSLRQAIRDANSVPGMTVTIDFAIPGAGLQTIEPITSLPPITTSVLIDGTSQPGFAGTPLIEVSDGSAGSPAGLTIEGSDVTVRGLAIDQFAFDTSTSEILVAQVRPEGLATHLSLLDSQGHELVQSDGLSPSDPDDMIAQQLVSGSYLLEVESTGGAGTYTLTTTVAPATAASQPLPVGMQPYAIVAGDFTGNGRLDLAVAGSNYNELTGARLGDVSVLLVNGDGTLQPQVAYAVGSSPDAIVAGDFTGDGRLDLAVANSGDNTVSVLLGNGDGTFQPQVTYAVGSLPDAIVAGDFNGNGRLDLAVANGGDNTVSVLLGNGDGTFQPQVTYAVGSGPDAIVAGDFTSDGRLDLGVANDSDNTVSVLLGNGDGTFQPQHTYAVGSDPRAIVAGDFTGEGRLDLAVSNTFGDTVSVLLGNGDGTFQPQVIYAVAGDPQAIVAGDFNGDGHLDLAVAAGSDNVYLLLGNGDGTFQPQVAYAVGLAAVAIVAGDFNGDGRLDLAVAIQGTFSSPGTVSVLLGNGDGTIERQVADAVLSGPAGIAPGDFTGDGRLDLAIANANDDTVSVLPGNGDGTFQPHVAYSVGSVPAAIVAGDFNGDGRLDLAVANLDDNTVSVLLGNGDGTFQPQVTYAVGSYSTSIVAGDFTGNGNLDLAVANGGDNTVSVLLGNGDGTFKPQVTYAVGSYPDAIVAGDFNGDGRLDLAVANADDNTVSLLLGNGDGTFKPQVAYAVGTYPDAIVAGNFTGDGRLDLAVANQDDFLPGTVSVLLGNGDGTFKPQVTYAVGFGPYAIVAGDFTGGGHTDLAVANFSGTVSVLLGNGDGTFNPPVTYGVGSGPDAIAAGDFTGDGRIDLAVANYYDDNVSVLLANGDGTFAAPGQSAITPRVSPLVADFNGDGTDDVLVVDGAGDILYRQSIPGQPGSFEPPVTVNPPLAGGLNPYTSRDIALVPSTMDGPLLASVDAKDDAVSLYAYRDDGFVRIGSLTTGQLPAQVIAADLSGTGWDDLVVRNAGDGSLSVFFAKTFTGPINPNDDGQAFLPPVTLAVGVGISDVQAVDTTGSGRLDLIVTNKLTGQVSVLLNLGDGTFAPPVPYRAGTGLSAVDPGSTPEVTSLEATTGVAAGTFTAGGPTNLVTINPGSNTMDVLVGLGQGRFANPAVIDTQSPGEIVRMGDFIGNGLDDLAVLTADGVSIYLANGQGGFLPPTTYAVPSESDGLTLADLTGNGKLDLLVGDAYGDVLVLLGNGNGTFAPYHDANQAVELAVTDLAGNGSKDIIYADQGLDRVVVDYGAGNSNLLANQSTGLLEPGAVALAYLNGPEYPEDLIVANSGSNNVLIYPGLGNGQFGPAVNGGHGYFVGTNPVGITVANLTGALPDLVIADEGSNDVSVLVNQSQGQDISFAPAVRFQAGLGPVATVVQDVPGGFPNLLVSDSGSNKVTLLPGRSPADFDVSAETTSSVGAGPGPLFLDNFNGQTDLLTVNAGSNNLTLISGFGGPDPVTSTIPSGGVDPDAAFAFSAGTGFEDLVVGNAGDGELALFEGGPGGLTLTAATREANLPDPTALAFSALTGGQVQFYAATAGRESAELVALSLGIETGLSSSSDASFAASSLAQLVPLSASSLPLVATVLTFTITVSGNEFNLGLAETEAAFLSGTGATVGQGLLSQGRGGPVGDDGEAADEPQAGVAGSVPGVITPWQRFVIGLDKALEQFWRDNPDGVSGAPAPGTASDHADSPPAADAPAQGGPTSLKSGSEMVPSGDEPDRAENPSPGIRVESIDAAVHVMWGEDAPRDRPVDAAKSEPCIITARTEPRPPALGPTDAVILEAGKDQPDLAIKSLVVAKMATEWLRACRWDRTPRLERPGRVGNPIRRRRVVIK
jgi:FG-GAP-like repeat